MNQENPIKEQLDSYEDRRLELQQKKEKLQPFLFLFPVIVFISIILITTFPPILIGGTAISVLLSFLFYQYKVGNDFQNLKEKVKDTLLVEFMKTYYPNVSYEYQPEKQQVKTILKQVNLVRADNYKEEDVLRGKYQGADFYFSEIDLEDESTDDDGGTSTTTVFKGILFKLKIPGRNFPKTRIQSRRKLLQMIFSDFVHHKEFDFWYETEDEIAFQNEMQVLLPFISHLKHQQGDLRIEAEGNDITIMMESKMKFLDDPEISINRPVDDSDYKTNIAKQLNTLLFIVDSFVNNLENDEITEKLELKAIEMAGLSSSGGNLTS